MIRKTTDLSQRFSLLDVWPFGITDYLIGNDGRSLKKMSKLLTKFHLFQF